MRCQKSLVVFAASFLLLSALTFSQNVKELARPWQKWVKRLDDVDKLPRLYLKRAVLFTKDDIVVGQAPIKNYIDQHQAMFTQFSSSESKKIFQHSEHKWLDLGFIYSEDENNAKQDSVLYVVAWRKVGRDWLRELDIILPADKVRPLNDAFAALRASWVRYANKGEPLAMVTTLFQEEATYLNNSEISRGHADIVARFGFMRQAAFEINLKSEYLVQVDDATVIDIGNWITAEFVGYYLIMWRKNPNNEWQISLYFNF